MVGLVRPMAFRENAMASFGKQRYKKEQHCFRRLHGVLLGRRRGEGVAPISASLTKLWFHKFWRTSKEFSLGIDGCRTRILYFTVSSVTVTGSLQHRHWRTLEGFLNTEQPAFQMIETVEKYEVRKAWQHTPPVTAYNMNTACWDVHPSLQSTLTSEGNRNPFRVPPPPIISPLLLTCIGKESVRDAYQSATSSPHCWFR